MSKVTITHTCGHVVEHEVTGSLALRQWKIDRLFAEPCWECRKAAMAADALRAAQVAGLPPLDGTPKQVAWAVTIRQAKLDEMDTWREEVAEAGVESVKAGRATSEQVRAAMDELDRWLSSLRGETAAKFWIERRTQQGRTFLESHRRWVANRQAAAKVQAKVQAAPLPPLDGTPDQVAWAESIRARQIAHLLAYRDTYVLAHPDIDIRIEHIQGETSAAFWIDSRFWEGLDLLQSWQDRQG